MTHPPYGVATDAEQVPARIAPVLDKNLFVYATVATAAGVGLLGQSAEGKIVYTAANTQVVLNQAALNIDLNNDGVADFALYYFFSQAARYPEGAFSSGLTLYPTQAANQIVGVVSSRGAACAAALPGGVKVGLGAGFDAQYLPLFEVAGSYTRGDVKRCPWADKHRGAFVGLKFVVNGLAHYGWAHVTVGISGVTLNGYAYETVPNQPIVTGKTSGPVVADLNVAPLSSGQPATLGLLAQGSRGLAAWRRPEES